jgi:hypothetical protein
MRARSITGRIAVLALAAIAPACATTQPEAAVLIAPEGPCNVSPDIGSALLLEAPNRNDTTRQFAGLSSETPCWSDPEHKVNSAYLLARLPEAENSVLLTVSAANEYLRMFALDVRMLNVEGETLRVFNRQQYLSLGDGYSLQVTPRPNEVLVLVTADPQLVGSSVDSINMSVATTPVYTAYGTTNYSTGLDTTYSRQFSYEGGVSFKILNAP